MLKAIKEIKNKKLILVFFSTVLLFGGLYSAEKGHFNDFFKKIGVYPESERYTALFFDNSGELASDSDFDTEVKKFTFGITNVEGKTMNYSFSVDVYDRGEMIPVENGSLEVKNTETVLKDVTLNLSDYKKGSLVYVTLPFNNKSIDFEIY
jgi:hypothetical protein